VSHKRKRSKHRPKPKHRCFACHEDDIKVVPVVITADGKRVAKFMLCRACVAGKVVLLSGRTRLVKW
jgi:hypothetical protein